jgi:vitamin B12 transporter
LRLASGRYHQLPAPEHLDPVYGNPRLAPLRADHVIFGWEWRENATNVRVEAYHKDYRGLVTQDSLTFYANGGHGRARGVDVFVQGRVTWLSGWLSYGWLDARRKELDDPRELPSPHGVRHTLTLVGQYQLASAWQLGLRYGMSSGRPYTPVVGRTWDADRAMWRPVFGENHSGLLPDYHRVDLRVTRLFSMPKGFGLPASSVCVAYVETLNLLDTPNVLDFTYSDDYAERRERESYFGRRLAVAGVSLSW